MLYPKNNEKKLSAQLFAHPGSEYRGTPFWAWNCQLDAEELKRQIDVLKQMGLGGFHMHVRSGMATPYLTDEFMELIRTCVDKARDNDMLAWLYDEDRWPSGAAGGIVTKDAAFRSRYLLFTCVPYGQGNTNAETDSSARAARQENGILLARYRVTLEKGYLKKYERLSADAPDEPGLWYAYRETQGENPWYNNQAYLDTLNPKAVARFIEVTHEAYAKAVGKDFGGIIPAIFTDEPQFTRKSTLGFAEAREDVTLPYTDDFPQTYQAAYGADFFDTLPELIWDLPGDRVSVPRYHYHDHVAERFSSAFADQIGGWCREHGIMLTGHMMEEPTLESQTAALGEAMRSYRSFQLPGIDMLCDRREFTTAKQAASATHQYGCPGVLSELYGVTNWDFDWRGHKLQGDWQAALGVTVRVHHLSWVSMNGEAKRDYPASMNYQSPWYDHYSYVEDYFARLNTALTRGKPVISVGVVHPVESYWLHWGPKEQTAAVREEMDHQFQSLCTWLCTGMIDFDYISESLLPDQCPAAGAPLKVGQMAYDTLLVPGCETLRASTVERLEAFAAAGGKLIFAGRIPTLVDAVPSNRVKKLAERAAVIPFSQEAVLDALSGARQVDVRRHDGQRTTALLHQMRQDGDARWFFLCQAYNPDNQDVTRPEKLRIRFKGRFIPVAHDAISGHISVMPFSYEDGDTLVDYTMDVHDSLLLQLRPENADLSDVSAAVRTNEVSTLNNAARPPMPNGTLQTPEVIDREGIPVAEQARIILAEDNVLLLDMAQWKLDDGPWQPREEILRLDNACRALLGWPSRFSAFAQPWVTAQEPNRDGKHTLRLKLPFESTIAVHDGALALEDRDSTQIYFNGRLMEDADDGWYVDKSIRRVKLPEFGPGIHELELVIDYTRASNVEYCYLVGTFGVEALGTRGMLVPLSQRMYFSDVTRQGLAFYGGNVSYSFPVERGGILEIPHWRGAALTVAADGRELGVVAYSPYRIAIPEGTREVTVTVMGTRFNTFGQLHYWGVDKLWYGPDSWRTRGKNWSYEYRLRPTGLLSAPVYYPDLP
jgi:hypothetical protein